MSILNQSCSSEMYSKSQCTGETELLSPIEFIEDPKLGLGLSLYSVQKIIIKAIYGIPLEDDVNNPTVSVQNWQGESFPDITEAGYLRMAYTQGRCNIKEVKEGDERTEVYLALGRRSGSTWLASLITAYETYKLLKKNNPHKYYGIPETSVINLLNISSSYDQAKLIRQLFEDHVNSYGLLKRCCATDIGDSLGFLNPNDLENDKCSITVNFKVNLVKELIGLSNLLVIIDNADNFKKTYFTNSLFEIYLTVKPSLDVFTPKNLQNSDVTIGPCESRMVMLSNPGGKSGIFYERFKRALEGVCKNFFCLRAPTWDVNPTISLNFRESHEKDPAEFWNMYGAVFKDEVSKVDVLMSEILTVSEKLLELQKDLQEEIGKKN